MCGYPKLSLRIGLTRKNTEEEEPLMSTQMPLLSFAISYETFTNWLLDRFAASFAPYLK